jgi:peptidoglycan/LPS O-acetylase OafA/YrhL
MLPNEPILSLPLSEPGQVSVPGAQSGQRYPVLDGLRGLAALGVVLVHYSAGAAWRLPVVATAERLLDFSSFCLDVFFILSGFLIGGILIRTRNSPDYYKTFYRRRFYRILPLYYSWIAIFFVFYFVAQGWGITPPKDLSGELYLASFALLFQNFFVSIIESTFIAAPSWSLAVEEHFYLLAPICVRRLTPRRLVQVLLGLIILAPIFRGVLFEFVAHREKWAEIASRIWTPCRADALAIGVLLAMIWRSPEIRDWVDKHAFLCAWGGVAGFGSAILLYSMAEANFSYCSFLSVAFGQSGVELASLSLVAYLLWRPRTGIGKLFTSKPLLELGKISYCLYLIHWGVLWMIYRFILHTHFGDHLRLDVVVAPIALAISIGAAELSWKYFESPLIQRSHRPSKILSIPPVHGGQPQTAYR